MKKVKLTLGAILIAAITVTSFNACKKESKELTNDIQNQSEESISPSVPKWLSWIGGLLKPKPRVEIQFGHNQINPVTGEIAYCIDDMVCHIKAGIANYGVGNSHGFGHYEDGALEIAFVIESISPFDLLNFDNGYIELSQPLHYDDFEEAAVDIGLPVGFFLPAGDYPVIYRDDEYIVVRFGIESTPELILYTVE